MRRLLVPLILSALPLSIPFGGCATLKATVVDTAVCSGRALARDVAAALAELESTVPADMAEWKAWATKLAKKFGADALSCAAQALAGRQTFSASPSLPSARPTAAAAASQWIIDHPAEWQ